MFTGIVEAIGTIREIKPEGTNLNFLIKSSISRELTPDQSVAHAGVCLTVTGIENGGHWVTAVEETLKKTNLSHWKTGEKVNLERALKVGDRLDGHWVQGHVDGTGTCIENKDVAGSRLLTFSFAERFAGWIIEKGSICLNGTSLTVFNVGKDRFSVTLIPYTLNHTSFSDLKEGHSVNIEFDLLGKYILRQMDLEKGLVR